MKKRIGLIGCGGMGTTHNLSLKALSNIMDIEVVALADCRQPFLEKASVVWPNARTYKWGLDLIQEEALDIVHICLPSYLHTEHSLAAMEKGMHVFVEKPVCLTEEEGRVLLEKQKETGVSVMVGQVVRSFEEYRFLKNTYDNATYGALKSMVMQRVGGDATWGYEDWFHDEKKSGSAVLDLHVHDLDFLRYMLGEPDSFTVKAAEFDGGLINQIITQYEYPGCFITAEGCWDESPAVPFEASFRACFEKATLVFRSTASPSLTIYHKDGRKEVPELRPEYDVTDDSAGINISNLGPYYSEIKYFLECLLNKQEITRAPLAEGISSVRLGLRELEAAKAYRKDKG